MSKDAFRRKLLAVVCTAGVTLAFSVPAASAADGDFATVFNGTGKLVDDFGGTGSNDILGAMTQSDGKLVVVGKQDNEGVVARFNLNGSFDASFGGGDGITVVDSGATVSGEQLRGVAIQPDGKIVAVGDAGVADGSDFVLARLDSSGAPDPTFVGPAGDVDGNFRIDPGVNHASGHAITLSGTKVIFGGDISFHSRVYQLNSNGTLDTAGFGAPNGFVDFDYPGGGGNQSATFGLAVQPTDGKIIAVGFPNSLGAGMGVARLTTAGALDPAFGDPATPGRRTLPDPTGYIGGSGQDVVVNAAGDIRVSGLLNLDDLANNFPQDAAIAGVTPSGALEDGGDGPAGAGFGGGDGFAILPNGGNGDSAEGIDIQPDGKLLIGGHLGNGQMLDVFAARYSNAGVLDTTFASPNGFVITDHSGSNSVGAALALSPTTGVAYVAGGVGTSNPAASFGIAAFQAFTPPAPPPTGGGSIPTTVTPTQSAPPAAKKKCKKKKRAGAAAKRCKKKK